MTTPRKPYDTDIGDAEWAFVAPYLTSLPEDAGQRRIGGKALERGGVSVPAAWH